MWLWILSVGVYDFVLGINSYFFPNVSIPPPIELGLKIEVQQRVSIHFPPNTGLKVQLAASSDCLNHSKTGKIKGMFFDFLVYNYHKLLEHCMKIVRILESKAYTIVVYEVVLFMSLTLFCLPFRQCEFHCNELTQWAM